MNNLSDEQLQRLSVLVENFDLAFEHATKIYAEIPVDKVFIDDQITEEGKPIVIEVMKKLCPQSKLGAFVYYLV